MRILYRFSIFLSDDRGKTCRMDRHFLWFFFSWETTELAETDSNEFADYKILDARSTLCFSAIFCISFKFRLNSVEFTYDFVLLSRRHSFVSFYFVWYSIFFFFFSPQLLSLLISSMDYFSLKKSFFISWLIDVFRCVIKVARKWFLNFLNR